MNGKTIIGIISICLILFILLFLLFSGYDISQIQIRKGFKL